jgi:predicted O-linked N-acetylglucosamine transferase (SPINDLY family)
LQELVTESRADYAQTLRNLCADRDRLVHFQQHLDRERERLPLFDTAAFTRAFEQLLEDAANGLPKH